MLMKAVVITAKILQDTEKTVRKESGCNCFDKAVVTTEDITIQR